MHTVSSAFVREFYGMSLQASLPANELIKENVKALLKIRNRTQKDLAQWCRRSEGWISKILGEKRRQFPYKYLNRIA